MIGADIDSIDMATKAPLRQPQSRGRWRCHRRMSGGQWIGHLSRIRGSVGVPFNWGQSSTLVKLKRLKSQ
jgi:hypothetical protein